MLPVESQRPRILSLKLCVNITHFQHSPSYPSGTPFPWAARPLPFWQLIFIQKLRELHASQVDIAGFHQEIPKSTKAWYVHLCTISHGFNLLCSIVMRLTQAKKHRKNQELPNRLQILATTLIKLRGWTTRVLDAFVCYHCSMSPALKVRWPL